MLVFFHKRLHHHWACNTRVVDGERKVNKYDVKNVQLQQFFHSTSYKKLFLPLYNSQQSFESIWTAKHFGTVHVFFCATVLWTYRSHSNYCKTLLHLMCDWRKVEVKFISTLHVIWTQKCLIYLQFQQGLSRY